MVAMMCIELGERGFGDVEVACALRGARDHELCIHAVAAGFLRGAGERTKSGRAGKSACWKGLNRLVCPSEIVNGPMDSAET